MPVICPYVRIMLSILFTIAPVFLMIVAGYAARKLDIMQEGSGVILTRFVTWIALPALMFHIITTTDWRSLWNGNFVLVSLLGGAIAFALGMAIGRLRGLPIADIAVDGLNASYSNAAYVGLPLFMLALGPLSAPYVIISATLMLLMLFAAAVVAIELGHHRDQGVAHALGKAVTGVLRNPVLVVSLAGAGWWLTGWKLPVVAEQFTHFLGASASPTALVAIGLFLAEHTLADALGNRFVLMLTMVKLVAHPFIAAFIAYSLLGMSGLPATMAVAIAALPTGTGPFMVAGFYARDGKVTSGTILVTTLLSILTLSIILTILPH